MPAKKSRAKAAYKKSLKEIERRSIQAEMAKKGKAPKPTGDRARDEVASQKRMLMKERATKTVRKQAATHKAAAKKATRRREARAEYNKVVERAAKVRRKRAAARRRK